MNKGSAASDSGDLIAGENAAGERLDIFATRAKCGMSRSVIQKMIEAGSILVNGKVVSKNNRLSPGDRISIGSVRLFMREPAVIAPQDIPLTILYEDEHIVAIDKPAGLVVHPGNGVHDRTLVNALRYKLPELSDGTSGDRPGIVHRLDKNTSGLLLVAKNNTAHSALASAFMLRKIEKTYSGFCIGSPQIDHGIIDLALARSRREPLKRSPDRDGKASRTEFWVRGSRSGISAITLKPYTGRTHQIRVHCSSSGFPIVADSLYGGGANRISRITPADRSFAFSVFKCFSRHALHAHRIKFSHPVTGAVMSIVAPLPEDFVQAVRLFGAGDLFSVL